MFTSESDGRASVYVDGIGYTEKEMTAEEYLNELKKAKEYLPVYVPEIGWIE